MKVRTQMMYDMETLLRKVFKQIRNEINDILDKELSRNEFTILRILSEQGPKKVTEFAPILEVSASHITAVTDALVEKEWITRIRSKEDRRIIRIHITEAGEKIVQHFNEKKTEYFFKRFDCYTDTELATLIELFCKLDKKR